LFRRDDRCSLDNIQIVGFLHGSFGMNCLVYELRLSNIIRGTTQLQGCTLDTGIELDN
jgi:hypothetical protein